MTPTDGDALVVVDIQNDFVTGSLAVPGAGEILAPINRVIDAFATRRYRCSPRGTGIRRITAPFARREGCGRSTAWPARQVRTSRRAFGSRRA